MSVWGQLAEAYDDENIEPVNWAWNLKHPVHLWSAQRAIVESLRNNRYTAVPACHDSGKSFTASVAVGWWLDPKVHPIGEAFVVSTAPTSAQVSAILWREIEKLHRANGLHGRINLGGAPEWKSGKEMLGYGRKPADYEASAFQGIHSRFPLIVVDEAGGIPRQLWDAIDALATNDDARVLAIGNPDDSASHFHNICRPGSGWNVIQIDGLATPNFTEQAVIDVSDEEGCGNLWQFMVDNDIPFSEEEVPDDLRPRLIGVRWVAERMRRWGVFKSETGEWKTSALWEAKVRGNFPAESTEGVIPLGWVEQAQVRWQNFNGDPGDIPGRRVFACDVARFGSDETAIAERQGPYVFGPSILRIGRQDTMTTADMLHARLQANTLSYARVDVIGVGAGVVDRLRQLDDDVIAFNASAGTSARDITAEFRFNNSRSAAWWHLRELLDPSQAGGSALMLPPDDMLVADLTMPRWRVIPGGRIAIEPKEDIIKRLGRSPDTGDAVVMLFWEDAVTQGHGNVASVAAWGGVSAYANSWSGEGQGW